MYRQDLEHQFHTRVLNSPPTPAECLRAASCPLVLTLSRWGVSGTFGTSTASSTWLKTAFHTKKQVNSGPSTFNSPFSYHTRHKRPPRTSITQLRSVQASSELVHASCTLKRAQSGLSSKIQVNCVSRLPLADSPTPAATNNRQTPLSFACGIYEHLHASRPSNVFDHA